MRHGIFWRPRPEGCGRGWVICEAKSIHSKRPKVGCQLRACAAPTTYPCIHLLERRREGLTEEIMFVSKTNRENLDSLAWRDDSGRP